ncbi:Dual-specificity kinase, spindle pole body (SPB) duplication and spindle checkpoint function [Coemansia sp. RSA 2706]|nr:Dual-specificity kinase, spindle pole body (SPB) duplication and spindle checkpoint function [Coemansia sp. RSA 2706]KAJ2325763.1 Serine/threonine kinase mps1 [Coemansia sp. RSA 2702]
MSLYGFDSSHGEQPGSRPSRSHYPSLAPGKKPASKLFDLSMDDFDDLDNMSDLENLNFGKLSSRSSALSRPAAASSNARGNASFQLVSPPRGDGEPAGSRSAHSLSFDGQAYPRSPPPLPTSFGSGHRLDAHVSSHRDRAGHERSSHLTLLSDEERPVSPRHRSSAASGTSSVEYHEPLKHHTPASHRLSQADSDVTEEMRAPGLSGGSQDMSETPAYKPPVHPKTQGSTVTSRWRRRGRLGLAKPKRYDPNAPSDDSTNNTEGDNAPIESSPPNSLDFLGGSSSSIDQKQSDMRFARSPPRSFASGFGSMDSIDAGNQRNSVVSLDDAGSADVDHTFQASSRTRLAGRASAALTGSQEIVRSGAAAPTHSHLKDTSDVSMNSNSHSRPQSPELGSAQGAGAVPPIPKDMLGSAGQRRATEAKAASAESRESLQSESARRRAMSPLLGRQRPPVPMQVESPGSGDMAGSPKMSWGSSSHSRRESPRQPGSASGRSGVNSVKPEVRLSAFGEPAVDNLTRFHQYEKRMNDASPPQFKSPRERQRMLALRSSEHSPEPTGMEPREDSRSGQRGSSSMRNVDWRSPSEQQQQEQQKPRRPEDRHYSSPRLSARRPAAENNFDALRGRTPVSQPEAAQAGAHSGPRSSSTKSEDRSRPSMFPVPVSDGKAVLQEQYALAAAQAMQPQKQQQPMVDVQPKATPSPQEQQHSAPGSQQIQSSQQQQQARAGVDPKRMLTVNGRSYQKISITGRGGSSKVYKAMSAKHEIFAIKRVSFSRADVQAIEGYVNEIILLRKFEGNPHIVQLFDAEINKERGLLHMVMEFGETDLASVLKRGGNQPLGMNVIRLYWEQMLRAVQTIHEERVVHADLKPANYLLVKGSLKLIDFGIAKAIGNDTTNIHRENQIGTVNYMSPEAIKETNTDGKRLMKLGRASDIWSLGIILYQMCYGRTPFAQLALFKKLASIPDPSFVIPYPPFMAGCLQAGTDRDPNADASSRFPDGSEKVPVPPDLLRVMRVCLQRDPANRMTIPDLLIDPLLCPLSLDQALPSAMSQMLSLLKRNPQVLEQWDVSESQNKSVLASLVQALHQQEQKR